jgi:hypothetical protein
MVMYTAQPLTTAELMKAVENNYSQVMFTSRDDPLEKLIRSDEVRNNVLRKRPPIYGEDFTTGRVCSNIHFSIEFYICLFRFIKIPRNRNDMVTDLQIDKLLINNPIVTCFCSGIASESYSV